MMLTASDTKDSATSSLRPYVWASLRIEACASFCTFVARSPPDRPIGVEAPTFVPGAIAATGHDSRMNAPAEAARAPIGAT